MARIIPLRTGWGPEPGDLPYYPDDLPEDWRLAYFANAFWGVLIPESAWCAAGAMGASVWAADVPERFRFYLDLGGSPPIERLAGVAQALGERLAGLVMRAPLPGLGVGVARHVRLATGATEESPAEGFEGLAYEVPPALIGDLSGARRWVAERICTRGAPSAAEPTAVLLGACGFGDLTRWQSLIELMGFS